jgi:hypothetical protein
MFLWLCDVRPEGGIATDEKGILAGVPAKEMGSLGVPAMMIARGPHFVEEESAGHLKGAVQVVGDAAFFAARGSDQGAELGFEQTFLSFFAAEDHDQGYGVFGELAGRAS